MRRDDIQTNVKVGAQGGSLTLQGALDETGCWRWRLVRDERAVAALLPDEFAPEDLFAKGDWVRGWEKALTQLDRYPWAHLYPLAVHPLLADSVLAAAQQRLGGEESDRVAVAMRRWRALCRTSHVIPPAPRRFDSSLAELFTGYIEAVLPPPEVVRAFHQVLVEYCASADPLFIVRYVAGLERGRELRTRGGRFRPSDNSPAWWVHHLLFTRVGVDDVRDMVGLMAAMPCHMHHVTRAGLRTVSSAGWHVAHILNAKDGDVDYGRWSHDELTRRFVRNLHPCNCFYVPKPEWPRYGGDENVLRFAAQVYRDRYGPVWQEFLTLAGSRDLPPPSIAAQEFRYVYETPVRAVIERRSGLTEGVEHARRVPDTAMAQNVVVYHATRLMFIRSKIDSLPPEGVFRVVTRDLGTFQFTRAQFEQVFASILATASWQQHGIYHMPRPPRKALPFRIAPPRMEQ